jgi:hypothetical protein
VRRHHPTEPRQSRVLGTLRPDEVIGVTANYADAPLGRLSA